jgi:hypothetical protein
VIEALPKKKLFCIKKNSTGKIGGRGENIASYKQLMEKCL